MRKDYLPVDAAIREVDESTFVEGFWTAQWQDLTRPTDVSGIARHEEYRIMFIKPGGWLFVSVPFHNWRLTKAELRRELELHGFHVQTVTPVVRWRRSCRPVSSAT